MMRLLGLDIGGANIKISDGEQHSRALPFALWREYKSLGTFLRQVLREFEPYDAVSLTMTAELADCFATKAEGVRKILTTVTDTAGRPVQVWQTSGEFVSPEVASEFPQLTASANWHALATWAARMAPAGTGLLLDVGSTTSDIIPLNSGVPDSSGLTDLERMLASELIYTGVRRTPICAVAAAVPLRGRDCPLAAEFFATMHDVGLILKDVPEHPDNCDTADGRPATRDCALSRLARMVCCDRNELSEGEIIEVAQFLREQQVDCLAIAVRRVSQSLPQPPQIVLFCGEGEFIARQAIARIPELSASEYVSLSESLGPVHSQSACAYALARLARERMA